MNKVAAKLDKAMGNLIKTGSIKQKQLDKEVKSVKEVCIKFFDQYD